MKSRRLVFADIEASGLQFLSYPIEFGWAWAEERHVEARSLLIKPAPEWLAWETGWNVDAENLHGIGFEDLLKRGGEPAVVCERLNQELDGCEVAFDTGSDAHDARWLSILYGAGALAPAFPVAKTSSDICILGYAGILRIPDNVVLALERVAPKTKHRAAADAAHWAWWRVALRMIAEEEEASPRQAVEIAQAIPIHYA